MGTFTHRAHTHTHTHPEDHFEMKTGWATFVYSLNSFFILCDHMPAWLGCEQTNVNIVFGGKDQFCLLTFCQIFAYSSKKNLYFLLNKHIYIQVSIPSRTLKLL